MTRAPNHLTIALRNLEKAEREISVQRQKKERIKIEAYHLLSQLSEKLIQSYYKRQFISLDILFPYFSQKSATKVTQLYKKAIEEDNVTPLPGTHFNLATVPLVTDKVQHEPNAVFEEIDRSFSHLTEAYQTIGEVLSEEEKKLPPLERKEALSLHQQAEKLPHDYHGIAFAALMIIAGVVLIGATHGIGAAEGAGFIMEGVDKIHEAIGHHIKKPHAVTTTFDKNTAKFLLQLQDAETNNQMALHEVWMTCIQTHCHEQQKSLADMKSALLPDDPDNTVLVDHIDQLSVEYANQNAAIEKIKEISDVDEKTEALKKIALTIEQKEAHKDTQQLMRNLREKLPEHLKSEPSHFMQRARDFYHNNKKIIQFAGIMAVAVVGIALTVATGGVAGMLGAAILGAVSFKASKSIVHYVKHRVVNSRHTESADAEKIPAVNTVLNDWNRVNELHCERQAESTRIISASLEGGDFPHAKAELEHATEAFQHSAETLKALENNNDDLQEKSREIAAVANAIHETDEKVIKTIQEVGDNLSDQAKIESQKISYRAKKFYQDNKDIVHSVGKVMLAVTALAIVGVASGGVGVALALGFAATAWIVKKTSEKIIAIKEGNAAHEDEREGESRRKEIKAEATTEVPPDETKTDLKQ